MLKNSSTSPNSKGTSKVISWSRKLKPKFGLAMILFISVLLFCSIWYFYSYRKNVENKKNTEYQKSIQEKVAIKSTQNVKEVVQKFGKESGENSKQLAESSSSSWDKAKLDKAYYNLIYADKVGSFNDVYAMLSFISTAEKSGLNIDDNSYGVDQKIRNDIKLRADKIVESRKKGTSRL